MSNPLAGDEPAVVDALGLLARHQRAHGGEAEPVQIEVDQSARRLRCQVVASPGWELAHLAGWAQSLPRSSINASRAAVGEMVVVTVRGCTADGLPLEVFAGGGAVAALAPGGAGGCRRGVGVHCRSPRCATQ